LGAKDTGEVLQTPIVFHAHECCGCADFFYSRQLLEIVLVCNECGEMRQALFDNPETLSVFDATAGI
jgi:hypothetical protein